MAARFALFVMFAISSEVLAAPSAECDPGWAQWRLENGDVQCMKQDVIAFLTCVGPHADGKLTYQNASSTNHQKQVGVKPSVGITAKVIGVSVAADISISDVDATAKSMQKAFSEQVQLEWIKTCRDLAKQPSQSPPRRKAGGRLSSSSFASAVPALTASMVVTQAVPLVGKPRDLDGHPVYAESARCQVTFGHNQKGDSPIRVTSIALEYEPVLVGEAQQRSLDYDIDVANLVGHGIVEERQYEFSMKGNSTSGRYLFNKDRADEVQISNILVRPGAAETVSIGGKGDDAYFGFTAMLSSLTPNALGRARFVATYDVAGATGQRVASPYVYLYKKK